MKEFKRRDFFGQFAKSVARGVMKVATQQKAVIHGLQASTERKLASRHPLLPPGARGLDAFRQTCTRCNACIEACTPMAIHRAGEALGAHAGFPIMTPAQNPCRLCEDLPCIAVCEPGALRPVAAHRVRIGIAVIREDSCYAHQGQPCDYCVVRCPLKREAICLDAQGHPQILAGCTGCGECAFLCPAGSIEIRPPLPEEHAGKSSGACAP